MTAWRASGQRVLAIDAYGDLGLAGSHRPDRLLQQRHAGDGAAVRVEVDEPVDGADRQADRSRMRHPKKIASCTSAPFASADRCVKSPFEISYPPTDLMADHGWLTARPVRLAPVVLVVTLCFGLGVERVGAAPNEIKVFTDELAPPGEYTVEIHANAARRPAAFAGRAYQSVQFMPEFSYGIWKNWEASLQLPVAHASGRWIGDGARAELQYVPHARSGGTGGRRRDGIQRIVSIIAYGFPPPPPRSHPCPNPDRSRR